MGSQDNEGSKSAPKGAMSFGVRQGEFLQTGGTYLHFSSSTSMLHARTVLTGSHLRDLAFPIHNHNFWFSKNMLISKKIFCPRINFPSSMVMIFYSSKYIVNNRIWLEEWREELLWH